MDKTKTIVLIDGKEYTITGEESAEYIHRVALYVNKKIKDMQTQNPKLNNNQLTVLTAINIADDYIKMSDELNSVKRELEALKKGTTLGTYSRKKI